MRIKVKRKINLKKYIDFIIARFLLVADNKVIDCGNLSYLTLIHENFRPY